MPPSSTASDVCIDLRSALMSTLTLERRIVPSSNCAFRGSPPSWTSIVCAARALGELRTFQWPMTASPEREAAV